jgi:NAD(P)-dependent dehydrogenase (short-subunit alcohol dehydrogenase family)
MVSDSSADTTDTVMNAIGSRPGQRAMAGRLLSGKVALLTGRTRGIGNAISRSLASQGASVAAGYCGSRDRAEQFVKEFERDLAGPGRATVHRGTPSTPKTAVVWSTRCSTSALDSVSRKSAALAVAADRDSHKTSKGAS